MSLNDQIMSGDLERWERYFKLLEELISVEQNTYEDYQSALSQYKAIADQMNDDFCLSMGIAVKIENTNQPKFRLVRKEEEGWEILMCNAVLAFGDQPCRIVDNSHEEV